MFSRIVRTLKDYSGDILKDAAGVPSSKRFVVVGGFISLFAGFWLGLIWGLHAPDNIVTALTWAIGTSGGGVAVEGLRTLGKKND